MTSGTGGAAYATPREKLLDLRVEALEERLEQMRLSRRVLLHILEQCENEHQAQLEKLERENDRLRLELKRLRQKAGAQAAELMKLNGILAAEGGKPQDA